MTSSEIAALWVWLGVLYTVFAVVVFRWTLRRVVTYFRSLGDDDFQIEPLTVGMAVGTAILWPILWVPVVIAFPRLRRAGQSEMLARLQEWVTR